MPPASPPSGGAPATHHPDPAAEAAPYLAQVRALTPRIVAAAEQIEQERRIPQPLIEALLDAGLLRLLLPRSLGGAEAHPLTYMRIAETIAAADASTAWVFGQTAVCAMAAAYLPPEAARRIFGGGRTIVAWGPPEGDARAVASNGGYRLTGRWNFTSGGRHATWLGAYCSILEADGTPRLASDGAPLKRVLLFPAEQAELHDVWHVLGLRGTASDAFSVADLAVPHEHTLRRDSTEEVREPGWLYRFKTTNLYACGFGSVALGVARALLEDFVRLATEKTPRGDKSTLRENAATQGEVGQAEARLRAARTLLVQTMADACAAVQRGEPLSMEHRMSIRLAATHATQEAVRVGRFAYEAAGATAIFSSNAFERRFRDLHTISQQLQGRKSHYQTVGKFLLGGEAETLFL